ncbi:MAG: hypothetical protein M1476_06140 [Candidatus Thermoplasmatota archaeon]|nr:hypothetical protein [Candidatus Thermoplasmatota archaeon]
MEREEDTIKREKNRAGHQLYRCLHCNHTFSETPLTSLYQKHLPETEIINICKLLAKKNEIRPIEEIT